MLAYGCRRHKTESCPVLLPPLRLGKTVTVALLFMCAIKPKHKARILVEVYTSHGTEEEFTSKVEDLATELLHFEQKHNASGEVRVHVKHDDDFGQTNITYETQPNKS